MTTTKINRRHTLLGTAAIPAALAPLGLAQAATTANATDAAWAAYVAAHAAVEALNAEFHAGIDHDDETTEAACEPWRAAGDAVLEAPVATLRAGGQKQRATW